MIERRPLANHIPPIERRPIGPYRPPQRVQMYLHSLPKDQWPERVYGFHPRFQTPICIVRDQPGYFEVSPEIDPTARNRALGISRETAEAVIAAAWAPDGHVWKR